MLSLTKRKCQVATSSCLVFASGCGGEGNLCNQPKISCCPCAGFWKHGAVIGGHCHIISLLLVLLVMLVSLISCPLCSTLCSFTQALLSSLLASYCLSLSNKCAPETPKFSSIKSFFSQVLAKNSACAE